MKEVREQGFHHKFEIVSGTKFKGLKDEVIEEGNAFFTFANGGMRRIPRYNDLRKVKM